MSNFSKFLRWAFKKRVKEGKIVAAAGRHLSLEHSCDITVLTTQRTKMMSYSGFEYHHLWLHFLHSTSHSRSIWSSDAPTHCVIRASDHIVMIFSCNQLPAIGLYHSMIKTTCANLFSVHSLVSGSVHDRLVFF